MIIKEILKWGPDKFAAIVTDNAANMVKTRRLVIERFPHMIEIRCVLFHKCQQLSPLHIRVAECG